MTKTVLIAGGGIGGLTAALALAREGCRIHVFEQADGFDEVGAGIQLSPNCVRVLDHLGLSRQLSAVASEPDAVNIRQWQHGNLISQSPLGETARAQFGYPYYHIHRADLLKILTDQAAASENISLHTNARVEGYKEQDQGVSVHFASGEMSGDLLIGADGIRSTVRARLFGEQAPQYTGNVAWRALIPVERLPTGMLAPVTTLWWGPGKHFVHYQVRGGKLVNCVCVIEKEEQELESWHRHGDIEELRQAFSDWHPIINTLVDNIDPGTCFKWGLFDRPPMRSWSKGNVTLLGDACHPTLPFMAQGAAMAIEDAAVLAACLRKFGNNIYALSQYERLRKPRTDYVQGASRRNARIFHMGAPLHWARDLAASRAQRRIMKRLYSYDPLTAVV